MKATKLTLKGTLTATLKRIYGTLKEPLKKNPTPNTQKRMPPSVSVSEIIVMIVIIVTIIIAIMVRILAIAMIVIIVLIVVGKWQVRRDARFPTPVLQQLPKVIHRG